MQMCPYCSLRRSARFLVFVQSPCWSQIYLGKNETQFFLLFSLYKQADCFHRELSKSQNSFREGTSHSYSLAQSLSVTSVYHYTFACRIPSFYIIIHHLKCSLIQRSPYYVSPILKVVCYSIKQIVLEVNHFYGMYFHSKVQKKLFALPFMPKIFHLSFPEQYTVHLASS